MGLIEKKIHELEVKRDRIKEQYTAAKKQARSTSDAVITVKMEQQAIDIKTEWADIHNKILLLKQGKLSALFPPDEIRARLNDVWTSKIHLIDYEEPEMTFRSLARKLKTDKAALLLVQDCELKMARLYWQIVHQIMQNEGGTCNVVRERFSDKDILTPYEYTSRLVKRFGGDASQVNDLDFAINNLLNHAAPGQIIPLVIECEDMDKEFLQWLSEQLWKKALKELSSRWGVQIVCIVLIAKDIENDFADSICKNVDEFSCENYFEIKLDNWKSDQVFSWFRRHDVIAPLLEFGLEDDQLTNLTDHLSASTFKHSKGTPFHIYNNLRASAIDLVVERIHNGAV
jgi:hypothetical protein